MIFNEQEKYQKWQTRFSNIQVALELLESQADKQLEQELQTNFDFLNKELKKAEIQNLLNQPLDKSGAIITISLVPSPGNSDDSQDWVGMLLRMYSHWCDKHDFKPWFLDESIGELVGFNYITLEITGKYPYGYLKSEQGIHQLRRISPFCKKPRIKTSLAKVEVTPILDEPVFEIPIQDLEITGKHSLNGRNLWVKILHIPTDISFTSRDKRSQLLNKETALAVVKSRIFSLMQIQGVSLKDVKKPSSKNLANNPIRQYIFHPYQQVKDLRTNIETSDIEEVIKGNIDLFIKAYLKQTS
ncbi:peptide chain release factor 2 [Calothrix parasitica NIES-267]|uniref:Peptide chain release factor 2 n=1 Tax=Calothrix parasitica NIES-267 TaxID=1973488 RepID=A0A1Z4LL22_9CYAN|nr:peptide chain release factor 2 [Calothrix parasitica NIES-267]